MVLSAIIGIESRFPGLDEAILYHVGVRSPKKRPPENIKKITETLVNLLNKSEK